MCLFLQGQWIYLKQIRAPKYGVPTPVSVYVTNILHFHCRQMWRIVYHVYMLFFVCSKQNGGYEPRLFESQTSDHF